MCGNLVSCLLKACDSRLLTLRQEATAMLYLLMRGNFEHTHRKGLTRIHLQVFKLICFCTMQFSTKNKNGNINF